MPRARARSEITRASPTITIHPGKRSRARMAQRSGPMPAGSPAVNATTVCVAPEAIEGAALALVVAVLDERAVAHLAQPVLVGLVGLARADRLARGDLLAVGGELLGAALHDLDQMPAEGSLDRLAHLAVLERVHRALEFRHGIAGRDPAEIAALGGAGILG